MKNRPIYAGLMMLVAIGFMGCHKNDTTTTLGNWVRRSDFDGYARFDASSFVINGKAYLGTGDDGQQNKLNDFWEYDPGLNAWEQKADFGGVARSAAVGFAAGNDGYIATGADAIGNYLNDCWKYDPSANTWTRVADFAGTPRYKAVAFGIGDKGYVTSGFDGRDLKDFWEYDPGTNQWISKISMGGSKREGAGVFVINNIAYLYGGTDNGTWVADFWAYDASQDKWAQKRDIANTNTTESYDDSYTTIEREGAAAFTIGDTAYVATGDNGSLLDNVWQYDPKNDVWTERTIFSPGMTRLGAVGFSVAGRGFVVTGGSGGVQVYDDLWEFQPYVANANTN